jgi:hypothetical protein
LDLPFWLCINPPIHDVLETSDCPLGNRGKQS